MGLCGGANLTVDHCLSMCLCYRTSDVWTKVQKSADVRVRCNFGLHTHKSINLIIQQKIHEQEVYTLGHM